MHLRSRVQRGVLLCASMMLIWSCASGDGAPAGRTPDAPILKRVLWWFPEDTQTVIVARDIPIAPLRRAIPRQLTDQLRRHALATLDGIGNGGYTRLLSGQVIAASIEGSRRFRAPKGLGDMRYEGCQILVFKDTLGPLAASLWSRLLEDASKTTEIMGNRVAILVEKLEEDVWTFYLTLPSPDTLIVATDEEFLREVLSRREQRGTTRALPEGLPEWKHIDVHSRFWAVRHYDASDAALDPTSPLREQAAANVPDSQATGLAFSCPGRQATVTYLSSNPRASEIVKRLWRHPEAGLNPRIETADGFVQVSLSAADRGVHMFLFVLLAGLGRGVFV